MAECIKNIGGAIIDDKKPKYSEKNCPNVI